MEVKKSTKTMAKVERPKFISIVFDTKEISNIVNVNSALKKNILKFLDDQNFRVSAKFKDRWFDGSVQCSASKFDFIC